MREKELRLALICYGGISLAVYMHGITKEVWRLARASFGHFKRAPMPGGSETVYRELLATAESNGLKLRVLADIVAGASAGGINGVFLARAISTGESLEPLTAMWLDAADVETLLDPDARPLSRFTKFWAVPLAWAASGRRGGTIDTTVSAGAREEVRAKLSGFVRARWFEPPFGGAVFTGLLLDAFDAMAKGPVGPRLLPEGQPLDLFVTVTDFSGNPELLKLNSPPLIVETEHRLTLGFVDDGAGRRELAEPAELAFAARATASFPGAFPPFSVAELDRVLAARGRSWGKRAGFLERVLPRRFAGGTAEQAVLIDGSVLANAPFRPAIAALKNRPARREIDRRFVYIDPKPGVRAVRLTKTGDAELPGFFGTIIGAMSDIPREQPIRDNLDTIENHSVRIRRMRRIVEALRPDVEAAIQTLFGRTLFLDRPTASRLASWRAKAQERAARDAGHAYAAYGHLKLSQIVEELVAIDARLHRSMESPQFEARRAAIWDSVRATGADGIAARGGGASEPTIAFFRAQDLSFRIRRLRFVARTLTRLINEGEAASDDVEPVRGAVYAQLAPYLECEGEAFYTSLESSDPASITEQIAALRGLRALDERTDAVLAEALAACPKAPRRPLLLAYLGFPYYDIATLPLLQGEGLDEFDPVKVDRIAPDDAQSIRAGGAAAVLKGIEFNSFGAFFSRAYRENDYLWGRLHGAERLIDIVVSTLPREAGFSAEQLAAIKRRAFLAILDEEEPRLAAVPGLFAEIRGEIAAGPLAKAAGPA